MTALDRVIATPRLLEIDRVDLAAPAEVVWARVRHGALGQSRAARALFAVRTLVGRWVGGETPAGEIRIDDLTSSPARPGFQRLVDEPPRELVVGAIGRVWQLQIPFVHVAGAAAFAAFAEPGYVKVAWAIRVTPRGAGSHLELEVRVDATDDRAWRRFRVYFAAIGPASRFMRRGLLRSLARELGSAAEPADSRRLIGDERLADAAVQMTHAVDIAATPDAIWPWLMQMGARRAGFYSLDALDNGNRRSAREIHPELQRLEVATVVPATPRGDDGFEVLGLEPSRALVLGGLFDLAAGRQLPFTAPRPVRFWHATWAFVLEPLDARSTRLYVRVRGAFPRRERWRAAWMRGVHHVMQTAQLRNLARRAEGRMPRDDWRDVGEGLVGAVRMAGNVVTPFLRGRRARWGLDPASASRSLPGDDLVSAPRWGWTHAIEIDAPAAAVWPWVAQVGADRGGFYSYQWLENLAGCRLRNAETVHPEWAVREGQGLLLHPRVPPLRIARVEDGRCFVAHAAADPAAQRAGNPWVDASWLFLVEPLGPGRCRFISRYRVATSGDPATRLRFGPWLLEPIATEMDRRMLRGVRSCTTAT
jgi:hypothetical protein